MCARVPETGTARCLLDGDAAVLYRLGVVGDLKELAHRLFVIGIRPVSGEFHTPT
jgi:hypothetical protein